MQLRLLYEDEELAEPDLVDQTTEPKHRSHLGHRTITPGKIKATIWAEKQSRCSGRGYCVYLVGTPEELPRHVDDKKRLGFTNLEKHVVVERDQATADALKLAVKENPEFTGITVIEGELIEVCRNEVGWRRIEHVDFDGVDPYGQETEDLIKEATNAGVDNIHVVITTRTGPTGGKGSKYIEQLVRELNIQQTEKISGNKLIVGRPRAAELMPQIVQRLTTAYEIGHFPYGGVGRTPMYMMVFQKR